MAGVFGPLSAGKHSYTIESDDSHGTPADPNSGNFTVVGPSLSICNVVVAGAVGQRPVGIRPTSCHHLGSQGAHRAWPPESVTVDGNSVTTIYGPYVGTDGIPYHWPR